MPVHHKESPRVTEIMEKLQADISAGLIPMGTRLNEAELADQFGTSRTPVRRALAALATLDILVSRSGGGHFIADPTREELSRIFEAMHEVELFAIRMAKKRLDFLSRQRIEKAQAQCRSADSRTDFLIANEAFHGAVYEAARNEYLTDIARNFRMRTGAIRARRYQTPEHIAGGISGHEQMMAYLFDEDGTEQIDPVSRRIASQYFDALDNW